MTEFRDVIGFPGYRVGDDGSVWSSRKCRGYKAGEWRQLKSRCCDKYGNQFVSLMRDAVVYQRKVHRLVLEAFVGPCPIGYETLHGDGHAFNNALTNLRWGTTAENDADQSRHGRKKGERHHQPKLSDDVVRAIRIRLATGERQATIAASLGVHQSTISLVNTRRQWAHVA